MTPFGYLRELHAEARAELAARRRRALRVRRYAADMPTAAVAIPSPRVSPEPRVLPRTFREVPDDYVHVVDPRAVAVPAAIIRPYYLDWERRRADARTDRDRLALAVLMELSRAADGTEVGR